MWQLHALNSLPRITFAPFFPTVDGNARAIAKHCARRSAENIESCRTKLVPGRAQTGPGSERHEEVQDERNAAGEMLVSSFARIDTDRERRTGFPEVVWGPGKTAAQIASVLQAMATRQPVAMATRIDPSMYEQVSELLPGVEYHAAARILTYKAFELTHNETMTDAEGRQSRDEEPFFSPTGLESGCLDGEGPMHTQRSVAIVSAGTSDLPVAEEAMVTAQVMGLHTRLIADVGVAGLHRLLNQVEALRQADVVIVVAGMDGALPSVVAGLVSSPVIAVPTSIGYGASFGGVAALLTMLNSCSPGLTVVNIDNGFGAALAAGRILRLLQKA